jgi:hypothetical protein
MFHARPLASEVGIVDLDPLTESVPAVALGHWGGPAGSAPARLAGHMTG